LAKLIQEIESRSEDFAALISAELGAPIDFARSGQVGTAIRHFQATLAAALSLPDERLPDADRPEHRVRYDPTGIAALITPWNWPLNQIALKVGAALVSGCPMILKPSEFTPQTSILFAECMDAIGLPKGVFNMVLGGAEAGAHLVAHDAVRVVSFTGSTNVGREIARLAAPSFKQMILELGGKSPNIVTASCDLEQAVTDGVAHCFRNTGQSCNAASLMLVERSVYAQAVEFARVACENTALGDPMVSGNHLGPLVSQAQYDRVQSMVKAAIATDARLIGGGAGKPEGFSEGYYMRPTVFADVTPEMDITRNEVFGPVLAMMPFDDIEDAIGLANDIGYGLAAYIQTDDARVADELARGLQAGTIQVNGTSRLFGTPFGGVKDSGLGREGGAWGIRSFQTIRSISGVRFHGG
jgi:aldehyde dehydrogenase (NAD+)